MIGKHEVTDDGKAYDLNTLYQNQQREFVIEPLLYKVQYLFGEIGGGYKVERVMVLEGDSSRQKLIQNKEMFIAKFDPANLYRPIVGVFDTTVNLKETVVKVLDLDSSIHISKRKKYFSSSDIVPKNVSVAFNFGNSRYAFEYTAELCLNTYEYRGFGAAHPVFFNIRLILKDMTKDQEWIIYKSPDDSEYNISGISVADINCDSYPDVLLSIASDLGEWKLIYFSESTENIKYDYMGYSEVYFIDP